MAGVGGIFGAPSLIAMPIASASGRGSHPSWQGQGDGGHGEEGQSQLVEHSRRGLQASLGHSLVCTYVHPG
jgi:hypothetical protein